VNCSICDSSAKSDSFAHGWRGANPVEGRSAESREVISPKASLILYTTFCYSVHSPPDWSTLSQYTASYSVHSLLIGPDHYLSSPALAPSLQSQARPAIIPRDILAPWHFFGGPPLNLVGYRSSDHLDHFLGE